MWRAHRGTKAAVKSLKDLNVTGSVLVVVDRDDENAIKSFRNLQNVQLVERAELNAYDVLCNDFILFSSATLPGEESTVPKVRTVRLARLGALTPLGTDTSAASAPKAKAAPKAKPAAVATVATAPVVDAAAPVALADNTSASSGEKAKVTRKVTIRTIVDGVETVEELDEEVEMVDADSIVDHNPDTIDTHTTTTTETIVDGKVVEHTEHTETEEHK